MQVAKDSQVLLTQVGTRLGAGAAGKHTCPSGCSGTPATRAGSTLKSLLRSGRPLHLLPSMAPPPLVLGTAPVAPKISLPAAAPCKRQEEGDAPCGGWGLLPGELSILLGLKPGVLCGYLALQCHLGF